MIPLQKRRSRIGGLPQEITLRSEAWSDAWAGSPSSCLAAATGCDPGGNEFSDISARRRRPECKKSLSCGAATAGAQVDVG
jgi:hypothetical protein